MLKQAGPEVYDKWVNHEMKFNRPADQAGVRQLRTRSPSPTATSSAGRKSIVSTNFSTAGNPMFKNPPGCYLYKQGNFIAQKGFFPDDVRRRHRQQGRRASRSRDEARLATTRRGWR